MAIYAKCKSYRVIDKTTRSLDARAARVPCDYSTYAEILLTGQSDSHPFLFEFTSAVHSEQYMLWRIRMKNTWWRISGWYESTFCHSVYFPAIHDKTQSTDCPAKELNQEMWTRWTGCMNDVKLLCHLLLNPIASRRFVEIDWLFSWLCNVGCLILTQY